MTSNQPAVVCWSGGKDSAMALYELQQANDYNVVALLTTFTREYDRVSMHAVRRELVQQQADSLGIELREVFISPDANNAEYESAMTTACREFIASGIRHVAFGDLFLEDVRDYRLRLLDQLEMECVFPIWKRDTSQLAVEFTQLGFRAFTTCVDPRHLDRSFVGREFDEGFLRELPSGVDPCGENGEFHSFVFDGPNFREEIPISVGEIVERDSFLFCDLISTCHLLNGR